MTLCTFQPFQWKRVILSDGSILWEICQQRRNVDGKSYHETRLASSSSYDEARKLAEQINKVCRKWANSNRENTIDVPLMGVE